MKFYEFILYWVSVARGYICRTPNNLQACPCQGTAASGSQGCATAVKENAGKERKFKVRYRSLKIAFLIIIVLMCMLMAVAQPLRVYALGFASETILELLLSSLAGTAAYAFLAAGGAELIVCILVGMGVSLTVSMIAGAINASVENGSWLDFVNECQGKFTTKKAGPGVLTLAMAAAPLLGAYNWVKEHILGIKSDSSGGKTDVKSLPQGEFITTISANYLDCPSFSYNYENHGLNYIINSNIQAANSAFHSALSYFISPNDNLYLTAHLDFDGNWTFNTQKYNLVYSLYEPKFIAGDNGSITITDRIFNTHNGKGHTDSEVGFRRSYVRYNNLDNDSFLEWQVKYDKGKIVNSNSTRNNFSLILYNGEIKDSFISTDEFIYDLIYNTSSFIYEGRTYKGAAGFVSPSYEDYYDAAKDLLSTTADSVNKKVAAGEITDETEGVIGVSVGSIASSGATEVTGTTSISSSVGVTDISSTVEGVNTMNMSNATVIGSNAMKSSFSSIGDKLPFSALKSISSFFNNTFSSKYSDSEVPVPVIPIKIDLPFLDKEFSFNIDFTPIKPYIGLIRASIAVEFIIAMYLFYKKWLINKSSDG